MTRSYNSRPVSVSCQWLAGGFEQAGFLKSREHGTEILLQRGAESNCAIVNALQALPIAQGA